MEIIEYNPIEEQVIHEEDVVTSSSRNFIEANTIRVDLEHLKNECVIPVFSRDNESTISHYEFIKTTQEVVKDILGNDDINLKTEIRVSHIIKGRIPSAIGKPAKELLENEKTLYYERCAFVIEVPEISQVVNGNKLNLAIGGVRAYNQENLYGRKSIEKFKVFIGFQNTVCTNLCISTDGLLDSIRISSIAELQNKILELIVNYKREEHIENLKEFSNYSISEEQFAYLVGKMKMYQHLSKEDKREIFSIGITDSQITSIVKDYYSDAFFSKEDNSINLWKLYNLFTEANKSSYIDNHLERNVNSYEFINNLMFCIKSNVDNWFLHKINIANPTI
jgi:hypothetical protein